MQMSQRLAETVELIGGVDWSSVALTGVQRVQGNAGCIADRTLAQNEWSDLLRFGQIYSDARIPAQAELYFFFTFCLPIFGGARVDGRTVRGEQFSDNGE